MTYIVDYGLGNLASIQNMMKKIGVRSIITSSPAELDPAERIILPGVGAFDNAMQNIRNLNLFDILNKKALVDRVPVLGICLGMQILMNKSAEGSLPGLGWIEGEVKKFNFSSSAGLKVPHMGWNHAQTADDEYLFKDLPTPRFYFVHSYYVECAFEKNILATTHYGTRFTSAVRKEKIFGTQFHPEKSHKYGMQLLKNFAALK